MERDSSGADQRWQTGGCPRCAANRSAVRFESPDRTAPTSERFFASVCRDCGLLFQNPRVPLETLARYYPDSYAPYAITDWSLHPSTHAHLRNAKGYGHLGAPATLSWKQSFLGRWNSRLGLIPDYVPNGRLLEVGCASGNRLVLFRNLGWAHCQGVEYSGTAAAAARQRGFPVFTGPVEAALSTIAEGSLDVIVAGFVIEHLENPFLVVKQLAGKLRSGGQFLFSTVTIEAPDFRIYGRHWFHLDLPRHMLWFRRRDLRAMLKQDFEIENVAYAQTMSDYLFSARYRLADPGAGWRWFDRLIVRWGVRGGRWWAALAWLGIGSKVHVAARKK